MFLRRRRYEHRSMYNPYLVGGDRENGEELCNKDYDSRGLFFYD